MMNRGQRMLIGLALLFLAPLGISFLVYYGQFGYTPSKRLNHGELLDPVRPLRNAHIVLTDGSHPGPEFFRHHWTLLFVGDGRCDSRCRQALYDTRQVRLLLNQDMPRVQRLFLATGECCDFPALKREQPDLAVARASSQDTLIAQLPGGSGNVYLIDPLGNLVMRYGPQAPARGMLEDLKRLLKLSQIG